MARKWPEKFKKHLKKCLNENKFIKTRKGTFANNCSSSDSNFNSDSIMKNLKDWLWKMAFIGILILIVFSFFKRCDHKKITVTIPEKKGSFQTDVVENKPVTIETVKYLTKFVKSNPDNKENEFLQSEITRLLAENEKLSSSYQNANDSLKQALYDKAIQLNIYSKTFEDTVVKIDISGLVRGEVQNMISNYTIKEQKVKITPNQTVFRVLAGGEVGNNTSLSNPIFKANLMLQNAKGNIFSGSYDANGNFYAGYNFSILNIKK